MRITSAVRPIACTEHWTSQKLGPKPSTVANSMWDLQSPLAPMNVSSAMLMAAVVRSGAAGSTVSLPSTQATSALGSAVCHYLTGTPAGFEVMNEFGELKDFIRTSFTGVLGGALAYLRMLNGGYRWFGHYEASLAVPLSSTTAQPDFVFTNGSQVAVVESKGTGKSIAEARTSAQDGYIRQVVTVSDRELVGHIYPTEGFSFGTALNYGGSDKPIEMVCVHKAFAPPPSALSSGPTTLSRKAGISFGLNGLPAGQQKGQPRDGINALRRAHYRQALRQMSLGTLQDVQQAANLRVGRLHIGPVVASFLHESTVTTATVAMSRNLLLEAWEPSEQGPLSSKVTPGNLPRVDETSSQTYTFVNFPDHVTVILMNSDLRRDEAQHHTQPL